MVLSPHQIECWERDGFLVLPDALEPDWCDELVSRADTLVDGFDPATNWLRRGDDLPLRGFEPQLGRDPLGTLVR